MRAVFLASLLIPVTAFSGCLVCEVTGDCWALVGVFAYVDLSPRPSSQSVVDAFEAMGYDVSQKDPYIQASRTDDPGAPGEIVNVRLHGVVAAPTGVNPPAGAVRLCVQYGDWSHHNTEDDAEQEGIEHAAKVRSHAESFSADFAKRIGAKAVSEVTWETHMHQQGDERSPSFGGYECF